MPYSLLYMEKWLYNLLILFTPPAFLSFVRYYEKERWLARLWLNALDSHHPSRTISIDPAPKGASPFNPDQIVAAACAACAACVLRDTRMRATRALVHLLYSLHSLFSLSQTTTITIEWRLFPHHTYAPHNRKRREGVTAPLNQTHKIFNVIWYCTKQTFSPSHFPKKYCHQRKLNIKYNQSN
jgi:hypothetical protein